MGKVRVALASLEKAGNDDKATAELLDDLRQTPPTLSFTGTASHTEQSGSGDNRKTVTVTTYRVQWNFRYGSWRDVSGKIAGLEKYSLAVISVIAGFVEADQKTAQALAACNDGILKHIQDNYSDCSMSCNLDVAVDCPKFPVAGHIAGIDDHDSDKHAEPRRTLMTRSPGVKPPFWMKRRLYYLCCVLCLGTVYRILFFMSTAHVVYRLKKEVSVNASGSPCQEGVQTSHIGVSGE